MSTIKLFTALSAFQQEVPIIHEGSKNAFAKYTYSSIGDIIKTINPFLKKNGLGFTQLLKDNHLVTIVFHFESGEKIESSVAIPEDVVLKGQNPYQAKGSGITYYRRYSLSTILGLVTDSDTDANGGESSNKKTPNQPTAPKKTPLTEARPKAAEKKGNTSKPWITEKQFNQAKEKDSEAIQKTLNFYQFRNKDWEAELQEMLQEEYNNKQNQNQ